jgi:integrase
MASVWKHPESKYWFACFSLPNGRRTKRSTKRTNRNEALKIAEKFEEAARNVATEVQARKVLSDIYALTAGRSLKSTNIEDFLNGWTASKQNELSSSTSAKYVRTAQQFIKHLGSRAKVDLSHLEKDDVASFRDSILAVRSVGTANGALKIMRIAFGQAKRDGLLTTNPAEQIKVLKTNKTGMERRAFTLGELKRVLDVADDEMKGLIMFGLYTGQRLGDLARFTWQNLDLQREELYCVTAKTGRRQIIPLARPLMKFIEGLQAGDKPAQPLFPKSYKIISKQGRTGSLSNQFYGVLVDAGIAPKRSHQSTGKGRNGKRTMNDLSFHALRHTATSLMKNAGISPAIVQEFIGHDSPAINAHYTHIETSALRKAAESLPDIDHV